MLKFTVLGEPVPKGRPLITTRNGSFPRAYTPKKTRDAESNMRAQIVAQLPKGFIPIRGAIRVNINVIRTKPKSLPKKVKYPITKPDLDNYVKSSLDSMNTVVFKDDAQIMSLFAMKEYGNIPMTTIEIEEL